MPSGAHHVTLPRTAKQRAAIRKMATRTIEYARAHKHATTQPTRSWWLGLDRQAFNAQAEAERDRLRHSMLGGSTVMVD
jgi:hypothetical protein